MGRKTPVTFSRLNSWDEICVDEDARLRTNTILFTGIASCLFLVMLVADIAARRLNMLPMSAPLFALTLALFLLQCRRARYAVWIAYTFGLAALGMSVYLLYTGGLGGYSFLWIFLLPNIAVMVISRREGVLFDLLLLIVLVVMLRTPLHERLASPYRPLFRTMFPLAILFVMLCVYVGELLRHKTQRQLAQMAEKLHAFAYSDPLTGIGNRHALLAHFGTMDAIAVGLSFAVIDLDFFKTVNDRYGHFVGDDMLCHIVRLIQDASPPDARLYRWGGEEFLLVLHTADEAAVQAILETIRERTEGTPMIVDGQPVRMTISMGGVRAAPDSTVGACIIGADERLYAAKANGRNRVEMVK